MFFDGTEEVWSIICVRYDLLYFTYRYKTNISRTAQIRGAPTTLALWQFSALFAVILNYLVEHFFFGRRRSIYHQRFELRLCFLFEYGGMKQESRFGVVINCVFISGLKIICGILFYGDLWKFITLMHSYILCC